MNDRTDQPSIIPPRSIEEERTMITISNEDRTYGMVIHLSALAAYVLPAFGAVLGPLVAWLVWKDKSSYADDQGKEALNFQLSLLIVSAVLIVFGIVTLGLGFLVAAPLLGALAVVQIVFIALATIAASKGETYRYPWSIKLVK